MIKRDMLSEIYKKDGEKFVTSVYRTVLRREPDKEGLRANIEALNNGARKENILFEMLVSEEAFIKNIAVSGFNVGNVSLHRLLKIKDNESFIKTAYIAILGRNVDQHGLQIHGKALSYGIMDKTDIIIALEESPEGQKNKITVCGLKGEKRKRKILNVLYKFPIIGRFMRFLITIARINRKLNAVIRLMEQRLDDVEQRLSGVEPRLDGTEQRLDGAEQRLGGAEQRLEGLSAEIEAVTISKLLKSIHQNKGNTFSTGVAFKKYEDEMRESQDETIQSLRNYDSVFRRVTSSHGGKINFLDLGCGKGKWLELAQKEYGAYAMGVDSEESMVAACENNGLNAYKADLISYIKNAASNSVDIISMIHVAEHLPLYLLNEVINECYRVLRKGGAIIIETQNPENMITDACDFYLDPKHITKIPPALLKILVEETGMVDSEIVRMHAYNAIHTESLSDSATAKGQPAGFFNNYADYAVIAYKEA